LAARGRTGQALARGRSLPPAWNACNPLLQAHPTWAWDKHEGRGISTSHARLPPAAFPPSRSVSRRPIWAGARGDNLLVGPGTPQSQNADNTARYIGREHASGEKSPAGVAPNREAPAPGVSPRRARECECLSSPGPAEATQHHNQLRSIYADCCHATSLSCPISQTWTPHRQDNLSMARATMSSSTARTEKG
jgi:hypothetical protein